VSDGADRFSVWVDMERCVGHGRCYELAPDVFGEDERGYCALLRPQIPRDLLGQAQSGEANCPEGAIRVTPLAS
jgi:ferredoxin